jgi:hypothetical protein
VPPPAPPGGLPRSHGQAITGRAAATAYTATVTPSTSPRNTRPPDNPRTTQPATLTPSPWPRSTARNSRWLASALEAGRLGCDDGADPGAAVGGARLSLSGARASAAALARDLGQAQQQLAAVHGGPAPEEEGQSS